MSIPSQEGAAATATANLATLSPLERWLRFCAKRRGLPGSKSAYRKFCRRVRGRTFRVTARDGLQFEVLANDSVANQILAFGEFEPGIGILLRRLMPDTGTFVDLGCNLGYFTSLVGKNHPNARLVAVDANPEMARTCAANARLNGLNASVHGKGIGARHETLQLSFPVNAPSHATFGQRPTGPKSNQEVRVIEVEVVPLRDLLASEGIETVHVLKIDVEGFEDAIFEAIDEKMAATFDHVVFEYSERNLQACGTSRERLARHSWLSLFEVFSVSESTGDATPVASLVAVPAGEDMVWLRRRSIAN